VTDDCDTQDDFCVLVNSAGQHSLWPAFREPPGGWTLTGPRGVRQVCLQWIEAHWKTLGHSSSLGEHA